MDDDMEENNQMKEFLPYENKEEDEEEEEMKAQPFFINYCMALLKWFFMPAKNMDGALCTNVVIIFMTSLLLQNPPK